MSGASPLRVTGISVSFGGVRALDGVDLDVGRGQVAGLIGPNGAGKTTLIDAITGVVPAVGLVELAGRDITGLPPHRRARGGLVRTWQNTQLFEDLDVRENVTVCLQRAPSAVRAGGLLRRLAGRGGPAATATRDGQVDAVLARLGIGHLASRRPRELTEGERKLVGVGRALAANPAVICFDEPAAGLDAGQSASFGALLRQIAASGVSILLVEHDMDLVLQACDSVTVLDFGRVIAHGPPAEVARQPEVIQAYLGAEAESLGTVGQAADERREEGR
jgi:branched-chain amino acid transport system ATP-binding protein